MAISLPASAPQPLPQTAAQAEALALRAGQVVEARVVGAGQGGTTQLSIGNQIVDAALTVRLQPNTLVQLLVQGSGPNIRLTVLPQPSQGQAAPQPQPQPQPQTAQPAPQPQPQPQPQSQAVQAAIRPGSTVAPALGSSKAVPQVQVQPQPVATSPIVIQTGASGASGARPVLVPVPSPGAPARSATPPVQIGAAATPAVPGSNQNAPIAPQLEPGTVLRFQPQGRVVNARPVLVPVANPNAASPSTPAPPQNVLPIAVPAPNPLQQSVAQTVQNAVVRQDSITTLLASLAGLGTKLADLPKPVAQAGAELLAGRLNLSAKPLDGAGLKQALFRSGVLFENTLHKSGVQVLPQGDLKSALLTLRNELRIWLGTSGSEAQAKPPTQQPPPPTPGAQPRAGTPSSLPMPANLSAMEPGARLLAQTESALARLQLTQLSSLPESSMRVAQGPAGAASEVNIELPLLFGGEMNVGQFQIFKDGGKEADGKRDGAWKMRFSIHFRQTGEVGATVSLRGGKTGVMLWAEREDTAAVLKESQGELEEALAARGHEPGTIRCRHGSPPQAKKPVGAFMDNCS